MGKGYLAAKDHDIFRPLQKNKLRYLATTLHAKPEINVI